MLVCKLKFGLKHLLWKIYISNKVFVCIWHWISYPKCAVGRQKSYATRADEWYDVVSHMGRVRLYFLMCVLVLVVIFQYLWKKRAKFENRMYWFLCVGLTWPRGGGAVITVWSRRDKPAKTGTRRHYLFVLLNEPKVPRVCWASKHFLFQLCFCCIVLVPH